MMNDVLEAFEELLIARASSAHSGGGIASSLVLTLGKLTIQNASAPRRLKAKRVPLRLPRVAAYGS